MSNMAKRIIKQMAHDKRSIAMIVIVPLFLLSLLYLLLGENDYQPVIGVSPLSSTHFENAVLIFDNDYENALKNGDIDAAVLLYPEPKIVMLEMDSVKVSAVSNMIKAMYGQNRTPEITFLYGSADESLFDSMGFLLLGVLSFFMIFLFSGISFVRERTSDTVERLMLTPVKTTSVVGGYILGFSVFAMIQSALMLLYAKFVLKMMFVGELWVAGILMLLTAIVACVMGILVSAVSKNEFQVMQFIPVIIIPQIFFSGLIPVDTLPYNLNYLSKIMPVYYASTGLKGVMVYGYDVTQVLPQILVLCGFIAVLFVANIFAVKKYRAV